MVAGLDDDGAIHLLDDRRANERGVGGEAMALVNRRLERGAGKPHAARAATCFRQRGGIAGSGQRLERRARPAPDVL